MERDGFVAVKSAGRAMALLDLIAHERDGLSFAEIQRRTGWPRSSAYNLVRTMAGSGHLEFDEDQRVYRVGLRLWEAGQAYRRTHRLEQIAQRYLHAVSREVNETVQLAVLDGIENVYIAKVDADHHLKLASEIGARLPAYATGLGKMLLASLDSEELDRRLSGVTLEQFTPRTIADLGRLHSELEAIRDRGYSTDDEEFTEGVFCVAVPIFGADGDMVAAMSCSIPKARVNQDLQTATLTVLENQAAELSAALGHRVESAGLNLTLRS